MCTEKWRAAELKNGREDFLKVGQVDCGVPWITYQVDVLQTGWYDVELLISRHDALKCQFYDSFRGVSEPIRLEVDRAKVAEWKLDAQWVSGTASGYSMPAKSVGKQRIRLEKGPHQLIMRFDEVMTYTYFRGLVFTSADVPAE
jgi:hypothetical protein